MFKTGQRVRLFIMCLLAVCCCLTMNACSEGGAAERTARADIVTINGMNIFADLERPPVQFPHDKHTDALAAQAENCAKCHMLQEDGYLSPMFMRLENDGKQEVMDIYHEHCIACHEEKAAENAATGPLSCGDCHRSEFKYIASQKPFGMDKSLHARHVKANEDKCENCHHVYDEKEKKLIYKKGTESSCRDCHRQTVVNDVTTFKQAAHRSCIKCHTEKAAAQTGCFHRPTLLRGLP